MVVKFSNFDEVDLFVVHHSDKNPVVVHHPDKHPVVVYHSDKHPVVHLQE